MIPTSYGRKDASLYIHGIGREPDVRQIQKDGVPVCITVTLLDGLVLARSVFNHSMNYRSVVVLGKATLVGRSGGEVSGVADSFRTHPAGAMGRLAPAERTRVKGDVGAPRAD